MDSPGFHRIGKMRGLYLRVSKMKAGGVTKGWVYRYVSPVTGKPRWMGLGGMDAINLQDASDLAATARTIQKLGSDPIEVRKRMLAGRNNMAVCKLCGDKDCWTCEAMTRFRELNGTNSKMHMEVMRENQIRRKLAKNIARTSAKNRALIKYARTMLKQTGVKL